MRTHTHEHTVFQRLCFTTQDNPTLMGSVLALFLVGRGLGMPNWWACTTWFSSDSSWGKFFVFPNFFNAFSTSHKILNYSLRKRSLLKIYLHITSSYHFFLTPEVWSPGFNTWLREETHCETPSEGRVDIWGWSLPFAAERLLIIVCFLIIVSLLSC